MENSKQLLNQFNAINKEIIRASRNLYKVHKIRERIFKTIEKDRERLLEAHKQSLLKKGGPVIERIKNPPIYHSEDTIRDLRKILLYEKKFHKVAEQPVIEILLHYRSAWDTIRNMSDEFIEEHIGMSKKKFEGLITIVKRSLDIYMSSIKQHQQLMAAEQNYILTHSESSFLEVERQWKRRLLEVEEFEKLAREVKASKADFVKAKLFKEVPVKHAGYSGVLLSIGYLVSDAKEIDSSYVYLGVLTGLFALFINLRAAWSKEFHNVYDEETKLNVAISQFDSMLKR